MATPELTGAERALLVRDSDLPAGAGACALTEEPKPNEGDGVLAWGAAETELPKPLKADSADFC